MPDITSRYIRRVTAIFPEAERITFKASTRTTFIVERLVLELGGDRGDLLMVYGWRKEYFHYGTYVNGASHERWYRSGRYPPELVPWVQKMTTHSQRH
jgi:hypothetical protein